MQTSRPVLLLTQDERLVQAARLEIYAQSPFELAVAGTVDDALARLADVRPCAIVVHLDGGLGDEQVAQLLWAASLPASVIPVLAVSDDYNEARARTMFQLGVTDYLGRDEHFTKLALLLTSVAPASSASESPRPEADTRAALLQSPRLPESAGAFPAPPIPGLRRFSILGEG